MAVITVRSHNRKAHLRKKKKGGRAHIDGHNVKSHKRKV